MNAKIIALITYLHTPSKMSCIISMLRLVVMWNPFTSLKTHGSLMPVLDTFFILMAALYVSFDLNNVGSSSIDSRKFSEEIEHILQQKFALNDSTKPQMPFKPRFSPNIKTN